jgi:hypothetical protein
MDEKDDRRGQVVIGALIGEAVHLGQLRFLSSLRVELVLQMLIVASRRSLLGDVGQIVEDSSKQQHFRKTQQ